MAGEGNGKERVKVSPGTMGFVEDLSRELHAKFGDSTNAGGGTYMGTTSGLGGLGGMGAQYPNVLTSLLITYSIK